MVSQGDGLFLQLEITKYVIISRNNWFYHNHLKNPKIAAIFYRKGETAMIRILLSTKLGELRWSQADLARKTGIRASTIGDYYNELTDRINLRHFELICKALDCDLSDILVYRPDEELDVKSRSGAPMRKRQPKKK